MTRKSELTEACWEHDLDRVKSLIAAGAAVDGSENDKWDDEATGCLRGAPYYTPLGEACRTAYAPLDVQLQIVEALLEAGAPVNELNYRTETALHFAAQIGRVDLIRRLAAAGADVNAVACPGTAVQVLLTLSSPEESGGPKLEALGALLDLGADPRILDPWGQDLVDMVGDISSQLTSRRPKEKARGQALLELMELIGTRCADWPKLQAWLKIARAAQLKGDAKARKVQEKIDKLLASIDEEDFPKKARRALGRKAAGRHEVLKRLTHELLMAPAVVAHRSWANLVRDLLKLTVSYADLTKRVYGKRMTLEQMDADEGGALDLYADENMSTVELCLEACRAEGASARTDFSKLVKEICITKLERIGSMSFGDEEVVALLNELESKAHPDAAALRVQAQRCFPFASWS